MGMGSDVDTRSSDSRYRPREKPTTGFWRIVSPPDAKWKAPYSALFHFGASAPGG
jgi:hypothetical protein